MQSIDNMGVVIMVPMLFLKRHMAYCMDLTRSLNDAMYQGRNQHDKNSAFFIIELCVWCIVQYSIFFFTFSFFFFTVEQRAIHQCID